MDRFTKKRLLQVLYGIIIILGLSFFIGPLKGSDLGTFVVVGFIRFFMSTHPLMQRWSLQW